MALQKNFIRMTFDKNKCFLCGTNLVSGKNKTEEHIFPRWLQKKYNLWAQEIKLLNNHNANYDKMKIPCCFDCNQIMGKEEKLIGQYHKLGHEKFKMINEEVLMRWICKIYYGILFKELFYKLDPKNPLKGNIITAKQLKDFEFIHLLLNSYRFPIKFGLNKPYSLFIVKTYEYNDWRDFDYTDNPILQIFSIRLGHTGLIMVFEDSEAQKNSTKDYFYKLINGNSLHPLQFDELYLKAAYTAARMIKTPFYVLKTPSTNDKNIEIDAFPIRNAFSPWITEDYAKFFWKHLTFKGWLSNVPFEEFYDPEKGVINFIEGPDGKFFTLKKDDEYLMRIRIRLIDLLNVIKTTKIKQI